MSNTAKAAPSFRSVPVSERVAGITKAKRQIDPADEARMKIFEQMKQRLPAAMSQPDNDPTSALVDQLSSTTAEMRHYADDASFTEAANQSQPSGVKSPSPTLVASPQQHAAEVPAPVVTAPPVVEAVAPQVHDTPQPSVKAPTPPPSVISTPLPVSAPVGSDQMSITVGEAADAPATPKRGRKPILGVSKVEKTFSFDPDQYDRLMELRNYEGLRLKANISTSEVLRAAVDFALAHVENNQIIPTNDGLGLHLPERTQE